MAANIVEVQTLGGIILLGGDFNVRTATLSDTININDLCEMLQAPELIETKQQSVVAKRQNRDANVGGWGHKLLDLCCDTRLLILNGQMPSDKSRGFACLTNGGRGIVDYIVDSPAIWQVTTHLKVITNDTCYCAIGGDFDHRPTIEHWL